MTKPKPLHLFVCKSLITFTLWTAPNGPKSCHRTFSSVSGAKLYTKMHHPDPFIAFPGSIEFANRSPAKGEYLRETYSLPKQFHWNQTWAILQRCSFKISTRSFIGIPIIQKCRAYRYPRQTVKPKVRRQYFIHYSFGSILPRFDREWPTNLKRPVAWWIGPANRRVACGVR